MAMTFQLKDFDGPLDLLLFLINKEKIDIKDIFVSEITDQYISLVRSASDLDMDEATEFLVMAASLLEIKSRAMLPRPPKVEDGEEDPEQALIRRLEEYKRFRETADAMKQFEKAAGNLFTKLPEEYPLPPQETELVGLTLQGLTEAFLRIWARKPDLPEEPTEINHYAPRDIRRDEHNVQECMLDLLKGLRRKGCMRFEEAFSNAPTKEEVVTYFLALLELLKLGEMHLDQEGVYGDIILYPGRKPDDAPEPAEPPKSRKVRRIEAQMAMEEAQEENQ
ncbi:MAG: segregation/condensation protein A [Clostridia bacterium]|nr:segregation/condensation protein A [Clostridia bacterium]